MGMADDKNLIVKMAYLYVQSAEWYKAIEEYKKLLAVDPEDAHVYNMMGDAFAKKQDDQDAFDAYMTARAIYSKQGNFVKVSSIEKKIQKLNTDRMELKRRHVWESVTKTLEADKLVAEGKTEDAVAFYQQLITAEPMNFSYREKLASLFLESAQVTEAVEQLHAIADIHIEAGRFDQAQAMANQMAEMDPEGFDTLKLQGILADKKGDQDSISRIYDKLGKVAFETGHFEEAKTAIEKAIQSGHQGIGLLYAKTLSALKLHSEAKQQYEILSKENPEDEELLIQLLKLDEDLKDWNSAYARGTVLLNRYPEDPALQLRMARILIQVGKKAEATQLYLKLSGAALKENKIETVLTYFDAILAYEPDHLEILKKKAELFLKLGKKQETINAYKAFQTVLTQKKMSDEARRIGMIINKISGFK
jgi:tetratricopeptide (TPR) repeat protein